MARQDDILQDQSLPDDQKIDQLWRWRRNKKSFGRLGRIYGSQFWDENNGTGDNQIDT
jgi:hypothetical protein